MIRLLLLFLFCVSACVVQASPKSLFNYRGQSIKPSCVALFNGSLSDYPFVKAISVRRCQFSRVLGRRASHIDHAGHAYFYKNGKNDQQGRYSYQIVGKADNGIIVLHTFNSSGNHAKMDMLLLLKFGRGKTLIYDNHARAKQLTPELLYLEGYVVGGNQCSGGIKQASVKGDTLTVWQYPDKNSVAQCKGALKYTINLAQL